MIEASFKNTDFWYKAVEGRSLIQFCMMTK